MFDVLKLFAFSMNCISTPEMKKNPVLFRHLLLKLKID